MPAIRLRADTKNLLDSRFDPKTHTYDEAIRLLMKGDELASASKWAMPLLSAAVVLLSVVLAVILF